MKRMLLPLTSCATAAAQHHSALMQEAPQRPLLRGRRPRAPAVARPWGEKRLATENHHSAALLRTVEQCPHPWGRWGGAGRPPHAAHPGGGAPQTTRDCGAPTTRTSQRREGRQHPHQRRREKRRKLGGMSTFQWYNLLVAFEGGWGPSPPPPPAVSFFACKLEP
jgi:hypothetical protein